VKKGLIESSPVRTPIMTTLKSHNDVYAQILRALDSGATTFVEIWTSVYDATYYASPKHKSSDPYWRHVDRRLQALRKKAFILYSEKEWGLAGTLEEALAEIAEAKRKAVRSKALKTPSQPV